MKLESVLTGKRKFNKKSEVIHFDTDNIFSDFQDKVQKFPFSRNFKYWKNSFPKFNEFKDTYEHFNNNNDDDDGDDDDGDDVLHTFNQQL